MIRPEDILSPRPVQVTLLSLAAVALSALWWMTCPAALWTKIITIAAYLTGALMVSWLLFRTRFTRMFEFTPAILVFLSMIAANNSSDAPYDAFALILIMALLHMICPLWKSDDTVEQAFLTSMMIALTAIFIPVMIWLVPLLWLLLVVQQSFSLRSLTASLIGVACVAVLYAAYLLLLYPVIHAAELSLPWPAASALPRAEGPELIKAVTVMFAHRIVAVSDISFSLPKAWALVTLSVIIIINIFYHFIFAYKADQYTRVLLNTWSITAVTIAVICFVLAPFASMLVPLAALTAMLLWHNTTVTPTWLGLLMWIVMIVGLPLCCY